MKSILLFAMGMVVGAGGLIAYGLAVKGIPVNSADRYNDCLQSARIGAMEHGRDLSWFDRAMAQCAKQYRIDHEKEL